MTKPSNNSERTADATRIERRRPTFRPGVFEATRVAKGLFYGFLILLLFVAAGSDVAELLTRE